MVLLELCCGTAGVTAAFRKVGLNNCIAIDKIRHKGALAAVVKLDLTDKQHQLLVLRWIRHDAIAGIFWAPPCGTASAARSIPIPDDPEAPQPLRSEFEPDGFSYLEGTDLARVLQANSLYEFCSVTVDECFDLDKLAMVENPSNSLFWCTSFWRKTRCLKQLYMQHHQACAYGSKRPKWTCLAASFPEVRNIDQVCPGNHTHEPWGPIAKGSKRQFATALEVHYPPALCRAICDAFVTNLVNRGFSFTPSAPINPAMQALSGKQPVSGKALPMMPNYKSKFLALFDSEDKCIWPHSIDVLPHYKLLHTIKVGCEGGVQQLSDSVRHLAATFEIELKQDGFSVAGHQGLPSHATALKVFGVPWEPWDFVDTAKQFLHPLAVERVLPDVLREAVEAHQSLDQVALAKLRLREAYKWNVLAKKLQEEEMALKSDMDPEVREAVADKRILLFERMLEESEFPDKNASQELKCGADLVGDVPLTGVLPGKFVPATMTKEALEVQSKLLKEKGEFIMKSSGDPDIDVQVWEQTMQEVQDKWLMGPFEFPEVPLEAPITRRFGLVQKDKVRLIDDYSDSGVNGTVSAFESPVLHTVDTASAMICTWLTTAAMQQKDTSLVARTFDLKSAYRQIGLSAAGKKCAYIAVFCPRLQRAQFFRSMVLPFGAVRSVHSFLRIARAIWWVGAKLFKLAWTSFYDDYILLSPPASAHSAQCAAQALLRLLGWVFAEDGRKALPFDTSCKALGVLFTFDDSGSGKCEVRNTPERIRELCESLRSLIEKGKVSGPEARRLHGRMVFADAQIFGRTGKRCLKVLSSCSENFSTVLSDDDKLFLELFCKMLVGGAPRLLTSQALEQVLLFTDACYERESRSWRSGLGGVMCDSFSGRCEHFSLELEDDILMAMGECNKLQLIFEVETLAAVVGFKLWMGACANRRCQIFVDNEGTKFAMLKGASDNLAVSYLVQCFAVLELEVFTCVWISRVPSYSNIADGPSRNDLSLVAKRNSLCRSSEAACMSKDLVNDFKMGKAVLT